MGLFSNKYITHVSTVAMRAIEDDKLPDSSKLGVLNALFGDGQLVEHILEELTSSIGLRAEKMYKFGQSGYAYGLPSTTMVSTTTGAEVVMGVVRSQVGLLATEEYYHFGPLNRLHVGWLKLVNDHEYDSSTNQLGLLSIEKGSPVYLKDMVVVVQEATFGELANGSLDQWGISPKSGVTPERLKTVVQVPHTPFGVDDVAVSDYVRVTYVWNVATDVIVNGVTLVRQVPTEGFFVIPIIDYEDTDFFQVAYTLDGKRGYWLYQLGEGTIPEIEEVFDTTNDGLGSFFPFGYFRYEGVSMADDVASPGYVSSVKMFKKLGMDYASILEAVDSNPDIAEVEQAMMLMAVPAVTTNPVEQRYLFDFFSKFYLEAGAIGMPDSKTLASIEVSPTMNVVRPQFSMVIQDTRFKMAISCLGMNRRKVAGVIGPKGTYASGLVYENVTRYGVDRYHNTNETVEVPTSWLVPVSRHYYQHQISDSVYEEVYIYGLNVVYFVLANYQSIGDEADTILLIPIDRSITEDYKIPEKETLYSRSIHYVFNSVAITKIAWYQTGFFKFLMVVVAVVITVFTYGASIELLAAALATMTAIEIAILVGTFLLELLLTGLAVRLFVKAVGVKAALVVAIILAAAGLAYGIDAGSIAGAPWAEELLSLSSNLMAGVQKAYGVMIQGMQLDALSFSAFVEEQLKGLETAQSLLDQRTMLSPFVIFGETPDEFYNRTVHSGNIGVIGLDAISSYVDVSLTLPKLHQTI